MINRTCANSVLTRIGFSCGDDHNDNVYAFYIKTTDLHTRSGELVCKSVIKTHLNFLNSTHITDKFIL